MIFVVICQCDCGRLSFDFAKNNICRLGERSRTNWYNQLLVVGDERKLAHYLDAMVVLATLYH